MTCISDHIFTYSLLIWTIRSNWHEIFCTICLVSCFLAFVGIFHLHFCWKKPASFLHDKWYFGQSRSGAEHVSFFGFFCCIVRLRTRYYYTSKMKLLDYPWKGSLLWPTACDFCVMKKLEHKVSVSHLSIWIDSKLACMDSSGVDTDNSD